MQTSGPITHHPPTQTKNCCCLNSPTESSHDSPSWPPTNRISPAGITTLGAAGVPTSGADAAGMCTGRGSGRGSAGASAAAAASAVAAAGATAPEATAIAAAAAAAAAACCCSSCCCTCCCCTWPAAASTGEERGGSSKDPLLPAPPASAAGAMGPPASAAVTCCWKAVNSLLRDSSSRPRVTQAARSPEFSFCSSDRGCGQNERRAENVMVFL